MPCLKKLKIESVDTQEQDVISGVWKMGFLKEDKVFMLLSNGLLAQFAEISNEKKKVVIGTPFELDIPEITTGIDKLSINPDGDHVCLICSSNSVVILSVSESNVSFLATVPKYNSRCTFVKFHPVHPYILIGYADRQVRVFNFKTMKILLDYNVKKIAVLQPLHGGSWSPSGNSAIVYDIENVYMVVMQELEKGPKKKRKGPGGAFAEEIHSFTVRYPTCSYKNIAYANYMDDTELLAIEVTPNSMLEKLPPKFAQRRFGM